MFNPVSTLADYVRKPSPMDYLRHPARAVRVTRFRHGVKSAFTPRRVAIGLGAAAVAVPLGLWIGRKLGPSPSEGYEQSMPMA